MYRATREVVRLVDDVDWTGVTAHPATKLQCGCTNRRYDVDEGCTAWGDGPCLQAMHPPGRHHHDQRPGRRPVAGADPSGS